MVGKRALAKTKVYASAAAADKIIIFENRYSTVPYIIIIQSRQNALSRPFLRARLNVKCLDVYTVLCNNLICIYICVYASLCSGHRASMYTTKSLQASTVSGAAECLMYAEIKFINIYIIKYYSK